MFLSKNANLLRYDPATTPKRNITLDDYDALPDASSRDKIEQVVFRVMDSERIEALLAPKGSIWPMDIFCAARDVLNTDPDVSENGLYFSAVSTVLCRALNALRLPPPSPSLGPPHEPSPEERRAMRQRIVANVHGARYSHPLRVQVLRNMHLKWLCTSGKVSSLAYGSDSDESEEDEIEIVSVFA